MYSHEVAIRQGRLSDALRHVRTAVQLSPGDSLLNAILGLTLWNRGVIKATQMSLENMTGGGEYVRRSANLAMLSIEHGDTDQANQVLDVVLRSPGHDPSDLAPLCLALAQAGRETDLKQIKGQLLSEYGSRWFPGRFQIHLAAREIDEAFYYLHEGIENRFLFEVIACHNEPSYLTPLIQDPRWPEVMTHLEEMEARAAAGA